MGTRLWEEGLQANLGGKETYRWKDLKSLAKTKRVHHWGKYPGVNLEQFKG